jgi:predicted NACHT family NTPase
MTQTLELIRKIRYDKAIKRKFIDRLRSNLFTTHTSFLSNPLLAIMMLLTFDQFAEIPDKMHLFYEQAFDTLFSRHDAMKEGYKRTLHCDCSIDVFKKYLSYFCLASYYEEKFEFNESEALDYITKGLKVEPSSIQPSKFLQDLVESVCILQKEGLAFTFTHRSFQEFFAAYCLARVNSEPTGEILMKIAVNRGTTDVPIRMLFDMDRDLVERRFIIPNLRKLSTIIGDALRIENF